MIADLKPYLDYRDSGQPWLGVIPASWGDERAKWLFSKKERPVRDDDEVVTCFRDGVVTLRRNRRLRGFTEATVYSGYQGIRKGDLVIHGMDAFAGAIGVSDSDGKGTPVYSVCQPRPGVNARFYAYLLRQMSKSGWILALAKGIRERSTDFRFEMFGTQRVPLPPIEDQAAIVRFLDYATGRLERAIRAKRKVIALLQEQKQVIIHRAVTRGLDPSVPLKPSGIPWLGDIPQHWEVRKLKYLTRFVNGLPFNPGDWKSTGVPIIRIQNLNGSEVFNYTDRAGLPEELLIQPGDLMFAWSGNRGTSFGSFEWTRDFPGYLNQHIFKLVGYTLPRRYFYYVLRAVTRHVEERAGGIIGLVHVTKPELGSVHVPIAPVKEAQALAGRIDEVTAGVDCAIARLEREIDLLREYRTRLVADVVTGKLDVREASRNLLDDPHNAGEPSADEPEDLVDEEAASV
ncbi:MAG: restriction endonuclease subunit S [Planctomycetes bacterium]|nr:restriction endonuclease subunit S [Planctomycetota bacterium]